MYDRKKNFIAWIQLIHLALYATKIQWNNTRNGGKKKRKKKIWKVLIKLLELWEKGLHACRGIISSVLHQNQLSSALAMHLLRNIPDSHSWTPPLMHAHMLPCLLQGCVVGGYNKSPWKHPLSGRALCAPPVLFADSGERQPSEGEYLEQDFQPKLSRNESGLPLVTQR